MTRTDLDVVVAGAGVIGLTTAVCLAEAGLAVAVRAASFGPDTTSAVAGAIWGPHLVETGGRAARWGRETLAVLRELIGEPAAGVRLGDGVQAARAAGDGPPDWLAELGGEPCPAGGLPAGFTSGWRYQAPLVNMPVYLRYLLTRFRRAGGQVSAVKLASLAEAAGDQAARAVVNCTGAQAHHLVPDPDVTPVRGQTVVVSNPGLSEFFIGLPDAAAELVYLFPHGDTVVLGGTEHEGDWNLVPDPAIADRILRDCTAIEPRLREARVLGHRVGLRPARPAVRLAAEPHRGGEPLLVHNYGHGGAGVTLSWGCAREVTRLIGRAWRA